MCQLEVNSNPQLYTIGRLILVTVTEGKNGLFIV